MHLAPRLRLKLDSSLRGWSVIMRLVKLKETSHSTNVIGTQSRRHNYNTRNQHNGCYKLYPSFLLHSSQVHPSSWGSAWVNDIKTKLWRTAWIFAELITNINEGLIVSCSKCHGSIGSTEASTSIFTPYKFHGNFSSKIWLERYEYYIYVSSLSSKKKES